MSFKLEVLLNEIKQAEEARGEPIKMNPITDIYKEVGSEKIIDLARDYLWFGDTKYE